MKRDIYYGSDEEIIDQMIDDMFEPIDDEELIECFDCPYSDDFPECKETCEYC